MKQKPAPPCCPTCGKSTTLYALRDVKQPKADEAYRMRIRNLVARFQLEGYDTGERDLSVACATAKIMAAQGHSDHMQRILDNHMERIIAAQIMETA